ncbi:MAG: NAD(P)-dependent oxidoreductase [Solirubrobacteraceae bacterium]
MAFLGLGIMGSRMAANVAAAGFDLVVWNRTRSTAETFCAQHEAELADTPAAAAERAAFVITMVVDGPQVKAVLLGGDGAATEAAPGTLFIDCSTIGPAFTHEIAGELAKRELALLDAPVTGSSPKAQDGTLTIMVGGDERDFERAKPVFEAMGELIVYAGPQGLGVPFPSAAYTREVLTAAMGARSRRRRLRGDDRSARERRRHQAVATTAGAREHRSRHPEGELQERSFSPDRGGLNRGNLQVGFAIPGISPTIPCVLTLPLQRKGCARRTPTTQPSPPLFPYADCFQRMGRDCAGTRRGRAAANAPQGRHP